MEKDAAKLKLSKSILEMKFMKRTKDKVEQQMFQTEGEEYFESQLTTRMKKESGKYIIEPSFMYCEKLIEGRLSFQGMNPEVERIVESELREKRVKMEKSKEQEISDMQMANHYKSSMPRIKNKNKNRNKEYLSNQNGERSKFKKMKFMKPSD